jgi:hypothetical protein
MPLWYNDSGRKLGCQKGEFLAQVKIRLEIRRRIAILLVIESVYLLHLIGSSPDFLDIVSSKNGRDLVNAVLRRLRQSPA